MDTNNAKFEEKKTQSTKEQTFAWKPKYKGENIENKQCSEFQ